MGKFDPFSFRHSKLITYIFIIIFISLITKSVIFKLRVRKLIYLNLSGAFMKRLFMLVASCLLCSFAEANESSNQELAASWGISVYPRGYYYSYCPSGSYYGPGLYGSYYYNPYCYSGSSGYWGGYYGRGYGYGWGGRGYYRGGYGRHHGGGKHHGGRHR